MNSDFAYSKFYKELETFLPASSGATRKIWVTTIIENDIDITRLVNLFYSEHKIASRFQWLLSEIGLAAPDKLHAVLPSLFEHYDLLKPEYQTCFASFWLYAGVPIQNEGKAIDLLFQWLLAGDTNITTKSRSLLVLFELTKKYPELKNELTICLQEQLGNYSKDYDKRVQRILVALKK